MARLGRAKPHRPLILPAALPGAAGTSYTLTAPTPASGAVGVASGNFTVTPNGVVSVTITPSDGGAGGTFTPSSLTFTSSSAAQTFTYTPASAGVITISTTNSGSLTDPSSVTYTATSGPTTRTDNFNRTNSVSALGTPSDGGTGYTVYQGVFLTAVYGISGNAAYASTGDTYGAAVLESSSPNADVSIDIGSTLSGFVAIVFRASDANNYLFFYFTTGASAPAYVYKRVDGATTQLATTTVTFAAGDTIKAEFNGSALKFYQNGVHITALDVTETFNSGATKHGFMITTALDKIDNLNITSLDTTGLAVSIIQTDATSITLSGVKGEGPYQWYRSTTFGFTPGAGNILSGKTNPYLVDSSGLSAGTVYEYALVASGSSETVRIRAALGKAPLYLMMVGDSVTLGAGGGVTGDPVPLRSSKMLGKQAGTAIRQVKTYNQGIIGAKTGDWISGSSNMIAAKPIAKLGGVTHVMITLGINDASAVVSAATYGTNLASQVNDWVAYGMKVILNYPTGIADVTNANRMQTYLAQIDPLIDNINVFAGDKNGWSYFNEHPEELIDGIHELDVGAESWSAMIATAFSRVIDGIPGQGSGGGLFSARGFSGGLPG